MCRAFSHAVVPFFFMGRSDVASGSFELRMPTTHDMFLHYDQMRSFYKRTRGRRDISKMGRGDEPGIWRALLQVITRQESIYITSAFLRPPLGIGCELFSMLIWAMMIAAAAALYLYARSAMSRAAAIAAMVAYIFLPYHTVDQYQRGAMAELLVFVWMPLMLLFRRAID
jgi:hypothetical protein